MHTRTLDKEGLEDLVAVPDTTSAFLSAVR